MTISVLIVLLKILAVWTAISAITLAIACYWIAVAKREPANHYPFPSGSILDVNHPERVL